MNGGPSISVAKRLIVSADDFGMSSGVNAAVIRAHCEGILTDTSLMVNGAAAEEAVALARATPRLSVGLHLVLAQGRATLPPRAIPELVDADGFFRDQPIGAALRYFFTPGVRAQVRREVVAQIEKFLATGVPLSHVDGHVNIHMHPTILNWLLEVAARYGIRAMRLTREPVAPALRFDRHHAARKLGEGLTFRTLSAYARARLAARGVRHPDYLFGLHQSGHVTPEYLMQLLPQLGDGVTELYCHPALVDAETRRWRPADYASEAELAALTDARVVQRIRELHVELITYRDLGNVLDGD